MADRRRGVVLLPARHAARPSASRAAAARSRSLVRYVWPLLFVVVVLIGAMLVTRDMGPLLIAGYGAGAFVAASVAMWWHQRQRRDGARRMRSRSLLFVGVDRWRSTLALFRARLDRRRHRGAARESRRAARVGERPARAGHVVPARRAAGRVRARRACRGAASARRARAPACRRRSRATTRSRRSSARSAGRRRGR